MKNTPFRWLDLGKLATALLPRDEINRIRYFTARINARADDPQQPQRQQAYIRALETIPNLTVHYGYYLSGVKRMAFADPPNTGPRTVEVLYTEEKGSDVNLGTYLLVNAMDREYELAVVISNDSDLRLPIEMVRAKFGLQVGIFCPHETMSRALGSVATFHKRIPARALAASQFPPLLHDAHGTITKPASW